MSLLRESLRHARHIVSDPTGDLGAQNIQAALDEIAAEKINQSQKARANGVATLDDTGKVPSAQLPADSVETAQSILTKLKTVDGSGSGLDADLLDGKTSTDYVLVVNISTATNDNSTSKVSAAAATKNTWDHAQAAHTLIGSKDSEYKSTFEKIANRNKVNGYAGLDSAGKLSPDIIPGQTIVNVVVFASTAERNADTSLHKGDMAIVESSGSADLSILKKDLAGKATTDADWLTLQTNVTVDVRSWNNRNGNVMPALGDYTTALILHDGSALDGVLEGIENSIPTTPGELDAYSKGESDGRFINKSSISYRVITANSTLSHGDKALVDMTGGNVTVTLPASPSAGMCVSVMDAAALADAKTLTVARNSQPIMGMAEDVVFDVPGYKADFVYLNATKGWVVA
ncbi:hypothetical protein [Endozoicomonas sp. ONNA2]|uniref:hypothetical protein n=1 Tax=Endozoicomonas sp. ONNA2 TaxID=2828741 RepID=UPI0021473F6E|nr:hypothetical protein [Endozoicomonas sp. ONNA2]